ncbi:MAG: hypothetical protein WBB43_01695 [Limnoraphis sp.]
MSAENLEPNSSSINPNNIANEIIHLQRKLEDIVQPYTKPISSILPPEEKKVEVSRLYDDIDIEAYYDRFSSWEGTISKKSIKDWLNQFETILDKNIADLLLKKFQFFSKSDVETGTRNLQLKLLNILKDDEALRNKFYLDPKASVKNEAEMEKWFRNKVIRYARFPPPSKTSLESQDGLWGIYERSALTRTSCPDARKFDFLENHFKKANPELDVFVFMDYTNGSGNQLSKCIKEINKLLLQYPQYQNSSFIFMYIVQSESFSLKKIKLAPPKSETIFYEQMLYYKSSEIMKLLSDYQITEAEYNAFIEKYCLLSSGKTDTGYDQSGSLTCHHYSCPNNTLPFFHKPSKNWTPLFRNSQTPSATPYKRK